MKKFKNPFQFVVLNDAASKADAALQSELKRYSAHQLPIDEKGCQALTSAMAEERQAQADQRKTRAQATTEQIHALLDDSQTMVQLRIELAPTSNKDDEALVCIKLDAASPAVRVQSLRQPINEVAQTIYRPIAFVFDFADSSPLQPLLLLLTRFVDLVLRRGIKGKDRVVIRLDSPGGRVDEYGLAAAQLERLRRAGFYLVVCVDQTAASGGYLMATVAHRIIVAPFATIGSIGVVMQYFNVHKLLQRWDVVEKTFTAGDDKRIVSQFSDYGEEAEAKLKQHLGEVHAQFRAFIKQYRPHVDLDVVATGGTWLAVDAHRHGLVDEIMTSDEYLSSVLMATDFTVLRVSAIPTPPAEEMSLWQLAFGKKKRQRQQQSEPRGRGRRHHHFVLFSCPPSNHERHRNAGVGNENNSSKFILAQRKPSIHIDTPYTH